jgi:hypothetical protein
MTQAVARSSTPTVSDSVSRLLTQEAAALETQIAVETQFVQAQPARETQQALETAVIDSIRATETASGTGMSVLRMQVIAQGTMSAAGYQPTSTPWPFPVTIVPVGVGRDEAWKMTEPDVQFAAMLEVDQRFRRLISFRDGPPPTDFAEQLAEVYWRDPSNDSPSDRVGSYDCSYARIVDSLRKIVDLGYYVVDYHDFNESLTSVDAIDPTLVGNQNSLAGATTVLFFELTPTQRWEIVRIADGRVVNLLTPPRATGYLRDVEFRFDGLAQRWKVHYWDNAYCGTVRDDGSTDFDFILELVRRDIAEPVP